MNTPVCDFVSKYALSQPIRMHMPGHKGVNMLGCERFDITEVKGADALYEADGIIAESERNASSLFGSAATLYSTEGSTQCIKAMLYLACARGKGRTVLAARNAHKAFVFGAALLDIDVKWLYAENGSICSCVITPQQLEQELAAMQEPPCAVYITCPDYLGGMSDVRALAEVCHRYGTLLLVDNAHGAYLHFLDSSRHPMDLGADICCDSAHKTLPVLTGGAYLHISTVAPADIAPRAKQAMALFGSTSPSYLILQSLDMCNRYLEEKMQSKLTEAISRIERLKSALRGANWLIRESDPLRVTICVPDGMTGFDAAERLRSCGVEPEYADRDNLVLMPAMANSDTDFAAVADALGSLPAAYNEKPPLTAPKLVKRMSIRNAVMSPAETISVDDAVGRVCASPTVSCPPAIPIAVCGEEIDAEAVEVFRACGINEVSVII